MDKMQKYQTSRMCLFTGNTFLWKSTATRWKKVSHAVLQDGRARAEKDIFHDLPFAKGMKCVETQFKALCERVLALDSVWTHVDYIKAIDLPPSLVTDASNNSMAKCFLFGLRYLHFEEGLHHILLDVGVMATFLCFSSVTYDYGRWNCLAMYPVSHNQHLWVLLIVF